MIEKFQTLEIRCRKSSKAWKFFAVLFPMLGSLAMAQGPGSLSQGGFFQAWWATQGIPRQNLQAEWLFNNNFLDTSGRGNHLESLVNTATNGSVYFANLANSFARTQNTNFLFQATEVTVSFWAKADDANANWFFMWQTTNVSANANRGGPELQFRPDLASNLYFIQSFPKGGATPDATRHTNSVSTAISTNWNHYVVTKKFGASPVDHQLYINNNFVLFGIVGTTAHTNMPQNPLYIGNNEATAIGRRYRGFQGRWRVYDRVLTAAEIQQLYNEGPPP
jgi:hypothetical protein